MTVKELIEKARRFGRDREVRIDPHLDTTDQTEQEITAVELLIDEDGREFVCLHVENT